MRMVLLGPPGSDKGEYAVKLAEKYNIALLTVAGMLADAVEKRLEVAIQAQAYLEHGQYIPDELLLEVIRDRVAQPDIKSGFILVGFPRSTTQADGLDELLQDCGMSLDLALHLNVEDEVLLERLEGRRTCISCGTRYNIFTNPPMVHGVCDMCGGRVGRGADSNEVVISNRLRAYEQQILSLVPYYLTHDKIREVEGSGSAKEVTNLLYAAIDDWTKTQAEKTQALMAKVEEVAEAAEQGQQAGDQDVAEKVDVVPKEAKATPKKKAPAQKKAPAGKAAPKKKAVVKKAPAKKEVQPKKKTVAKKKAVTPKKTTAKKKAPAKKAVVTKKAVATKKAPVKKKTVAKQKAVVKNPTATKKKTAVKKPSTSKKKAVVKKTAVKKKAPVKKKTAVKKKDKKK